MNHNSLEKQPLLSVENRNNFVPNNANVTQNTTLPNKTNPDTTAFKNRILGVILVIMAGMCFTGSNVIQKYVIPEVTFWQLLFIRALVQTLLTSLTCIFMHFKFRASKILNSLSKILREHKVNKKLEFKS